MVLPDRARSCHVWSGNAASRSYVEANAYGASRSASSRMSRMARQSSGPTTLSSVMWSMLPGRPDRTPPSFCWNRAMCTAIIGVGPDGTVLLAGVRGEFVQRAWQPPGHHWADRPAQPGQAALSGRVGGRDELAGGTWLALEPDVPRVAC